MDIDKEIRKFIEKLSSKIKIKKIIIFGSTARGDRLKQSDVDLIVISDDFEKMPLNERFRIVYMEWPKAIDADIIPLTESEFNKAEKLSVILRDAKKYWKVIEIRKDQH